MCFHGEKSPPKNWAFPQTPPPHPPPSLSSSVTHRAARVLEPTEGLPSPPLEAPAPPSPEASSCSAGGSWSLRRRALLLLDRRTAAAFLSLTQPPLPLRFPDTARSLAWGASSADFRAAPPSPCHSSRRTTSLLRSSPLLWPPPSILGSTGSREPNGVSAEWQSTASFLLPLLAMARKRAMGFLQGGLMCSR